ncbi:MAG TPA: transposase [Planctomycetota bacterium]|nr:transposase [Planctomycetota bacterium]
MKSRRRWRWPDGHYHVFNRGARKLNIFADVADRGYFVHLLRLASRTRKVLVVAWCLMDNHYHLVLKGSGEAIGQMIRDLEKCYARRFNAKTGHVGALFQGRFGSTWLPDLRAVAYVTRYVHANPRGKGATPAAYRWSSLKAYLGSAPTPDWLFPQSVLDYVGGRAAYREYMNDVPPLRYKAPEEDTAETVFLSHLAERVEESLRARPELHEGLSTEILVCWIAMRAFALPPRVLARLMGFSSGHCVSSLVTRMHERLQARPELRACLEEVLSK